MKILDNLKVYLYLNSSEYNKYHKSSYDLDIVVNSFNQNEYIFELELNNKYLVCINDSNNIILKYDDEALVKEAFKTILCYNLNVSNIGSIYQKDYNEVFKKSYKKFLVSGGCFWCINYAFSDLNGVILVRSGYCGGSEFNPTYYETKNGLNHHKETILVIYDSDIISYDELLDVYFNSIDPFDPDGQFIDKGLMYTCCIYTNDIEELTKVRNRIMELEERSNKKVYVSTSKDMLLYNAEDYHQDYHKKNKEEFRKEMIESKRIKE